MISELDVFIIDNYEDQVQILNEKETPREMQVELRSFF